MCYPVLHTAQLLNYHQWVHPWSRWTNSCEMTLGKSCFSYPWPISLIISCHSKQEAACFRHLSIYLPKLNFIDVQLPTPKPDTSLSQLIPRASNTYSVMEGTLLNHFWFWTSSYTKYTFIYIHFSIFILFLAWSSNTVLQVFFCYRYCWSKTD